MRRLWTTPRAETERATERDRPICGTERSSRPQASLCTSLAVCGRYRGDTKTPIIFGVRSEPHSLKFHFVVVKQISRFTRAPTAPIVHPSNTNPLITDAAEPLGDTK